MDPGNRKTGFPEKDFSDKGDLIMTELKKTLNQSRKRKAEKSKYSGRNA